MSAKLTLTLILIGLSVIFIIQNTAAVDIRFLFWKLSMSRSIFMFLLLAIGALSGWLLHSYYIHHKK